MKNLKKLSRVELKELKGGLQYCQSYTMVAWCTDEIANDTVCYTLGDQASKDHAYECMRENGRLWNVYNCGTENYGS